MEKKQTKIKTTEMKNLLIALAEFQHECPIIHKDTTGFNYTYADLPQILSTIKPLLRKHGLCFTQPLEGNSIRTIVFHIQTGEYIESLTEIPIIELAKMNAYQSFGSGITYYRRYALSSILGLVTDKDTDAAGEQTKVIQGNKKIPMTDAIFGKLSERYNAGETDVFDKAMQHYTFTFEDLENINKIKNNKK